MFERLQPRSPSTVTSHDEATTVYAGTILNLDHCVSRREEACAAMSVDHRISARVRTRARKRDQRSTGGGEDGRCARWV